VRRPAPAPAATPADTLDDRALNRALLARQHLLRRAALSTPAAVEHLVGLQAQATLPPYVGLWSRLAGFDPHALGRMLTDRSAVRLTLLRGTVHLVTARDACTLRPLVQGVIEHGHRGAFGRHMGGVDLARLAADTRTLLRDGPLTARELGRRLVARGIGTDVQAVGRAAGVYVPLVQVPPRGVWGAGGAAAYATLQAWTGGDLAPEPSVDALILRYLGAFGPASVRDAQAWSGLTRLASAFVRLRPRLAAFRDARGRELFDLPDAPRPPGEGPAPVRFLGEFDNVWLAHADRSRILPAGYRWGHIVHGRSLGHVLVDGMVRAGWWIERDGTRQATLTVRPFDSLSAGERDAVAAEGHGVLGFAALEVSRRDVRFEAARG
jgi:hypothetical protein